MTVWMTEKKRSKSLWNYLGCKSMIYNSTYEFTHEIALGSGVIWLRHDIAQRTMKLIIVFCFWFFVHVFMSLFLLSICLNAFSPHADENGREILHRISSQSPYAFHTVTANWWSIFCHVCNKKTNKLMTRRRFNFKISANLRIANVRLFSQRRKNTNFIYSMRSYQWINHTSVFFFSFAVIPYFYFLFSVFFLRPEYASCAFTWKLSLQMSIHAYCHSYIHIFFYEIDNW